MVEYLARRARVADRLVELFGPPPSLIGGSGRVSIWAMGGPQTE